MRVISTILKTVRYFLNGIVCVRIIRFKWKAVYKVPVLLLLIDLAIFAFQLIEIGFADTLMWTMLYAIFVLVGVAIAFLLHYALRKEEKK